MKHEQALPIGREQLRAALKGEYPAQRLIPVGKAEAEAQPGTFTLHKEEAVA